MLVIDGLHASVQPERGQRLFLALAEGDGRAPEGDFEVGVWRGVMSGTWCVEAGEGLLEDVAWTDEGGHAGRSSP